MALLPDGVRSTNDEFRDEIESILDQIVPVYVSDDRLITVKASEVNETFDWAAIVEHLIGLPAAVR